MLSVSCSRAFAGSFVSSADDQLEGTDGNLPELAGTGLEHVGQRTSCVEGGAKTPKGSCGWTDLRENFSSESRVETSWETAMWNRLRGGVQRWVGMNGVGSRIWCFCCVASRFFALQDGAACPAKDGAPTRCQMDGCSLSGGPHPLSTKWPVRDRQFSKPPAIDPRDSQVTLQPEASRRGPSPVSRQGSSDEIGGQWQQWARRTPLSRIYQRH